MKRMDSDLRAARLRGGFKSARSAALTFSWPESAYSAHESGTRQAPSEKMKQYFDAFSKATPPEINANSRYLSAGPNIVESLLRERRLKKKTNTEAAARRLMLSRRLAGFNAAAQAIEFYGWGEQSYYAHESGRRSIPEPTADKYGLAFSVSSAWLLRGELPSGLASGPASTEMDILANRFSFSNSSGFPGELVRLASTDRRADKAIVSQFSRTRLQRKTRSTAMSSTGDVLEVVHEEGDIIASRAWGFPSGFLSQVWNITSDNLRILGIIKDTAGFAAGDRILIDCHDITVRAGHTFAVEHQDGAIALLKGSVESYPSLAFVTVLGRVVATLQRAP